MNITKLTYPLAVLVIVGSGLSGCVTAKKYDDLLRQKAALEKAKTECDTSLEQAKTRTSELTDELSEARQTNQKLVADSAQLGQLYRRNKSLYDDLFEKYDRLDKSYNQLLNNSNTEKGTLTSDLAKREKELQAAMAQTEKLNADLQSREQRVKELERILQEKDKAVEELRTRVNNALLSFKGSDLSVDVRNGKVYVSLSEKLLFKSGSYAVDPKGASALKKLAGVLKEQPDINVVVEGHTDDVPISKNAGVINDNWDLSVMRATSIVKLLVDEGAPPEKLSAAGRSKYLPLDPAKTTEARQKNRRTEIILTPKLDELFKVLESN